MFIALALTLCTMVGNNDEACNTYFIDTFTPVEVSTDISLSEQWGDCTERLQDETDAARNAALKDRASRPSAKNGETTKHRQAFLSQYNITEDVATLDIWQFSCARVKAEDTP